MRQVKALVAHQDPALITARQPSFFRLPAHLCEQLLDVRPGPAVISKVLGRSAQSIPPRDKKSLVGRAAEMLVLHAALGAVARHATPRVVYLRGPSGLGDSALTAGLAASLADLSPAPLVLSGRCYEQQSVPYEGLDSLVDSLSRHLTGAPHVEVVALMPLDAAVLGRGFPALVRVPAIAEAPRIARAAHDLDLRRRAFVAWKELFALIAFRRPLVWNVDNLQWADVDTATFLRELLAPPIPPQSSSSPVSRR